MKLNAEIISAIQSSETIQNKNAEVSLPGLFVIRVELVILHS